MDHESELALRIECTLFFQANPFTFETVEGLALRMGRTVQALLPTLNYLSERNIVEKIESGDQIIYRYIQPDITVRMEA